MDLTNRVAATSSTLFDSSVREAAKKAKLNGVWTICGVDPVGLFPLLDRSNRPIAA